MLYKGLSPVLAATHGAELERLPPPLKWAGGKRWLVPRLGRIWAPHYRKRLVEPFVGGLAVTLGLRPTHALLNDANPHVIAFYRWLQRGLVVNGVGKWFENDRVVYVRNRDRFNELVTAGSLEDEETALLFYYLNRTGFNGLCRFNSRGLFNVPFGRYRRIRYRESFTEYQALLKAYEFLSGDFEAIPLRKSDFIYADPPYDVDFTSYSAGGFDWSDQERLAKWLASHKGPVVASNQATGRVLKLYRGLGFRTRILPAPRRISCDGNREEAREMLATLNL